MRHRPRLARHSVRLSVASSQTPKPVPIPQAVTVSAPRVAAAPAPDRPIPRVLDRAIRTAAAALPTMGDDPVTHLNAVIDAFEAFNPQTLTDTMLVSRFLLLGGAAEGLQQRAINPALPAVQAERLTRTALSALRTQERILRLLTHQRAADGADHAADPGAWAQWRQDLLRREERDRAAAEQRAAREAEAAQAAEEAGIATPAQQPNHNPMQSGEPVEPVARRDTWRDEDRHDRADLAWPTHQAVAASTAEATTAVVRAHAA